MKANYLIVFGIVTLMGCLPSGQTVTMTGTVYDAPNAAGGVVGGAGVRTLDGTGATIGEVTSAEGGTFEVPVPEGEGFFVQVEGPSGEGYIPTAFSGTAGMNDFDAGIGFPWVSSPDWFAEFQADWAGCPGADVAGTPGSGVALVGEVRMWLNIDDIDQMPIQQGATVLVSPATGDEVAGCYHDADGVYSDAATGTGSDGLFAVFGVSPGVTSGGLTVTIEYDDTSGTRTPVIYQYQAQDAGLVPIYPTFVYDGG